MFPCRRCGLDTPRLTVTQTRCPECQREVNALVAQDDRRRSTVRFERARDTSRVVAA